MHSLSKMKFIDDYGGVEKKKWECNKEDHS